MAASTEPVKRRTGGRSKRLRRAVLEATMAELGEVGYAELTFERVARRAGVHKTTIYRNWDTREQLVLETMLEQAREGVPVSDSGSLRSDLSALGRGALATAVTPQSQTVLRTVIGVGPRHTGIAMANRDFWTERLAMDAAIVERAIARGEVDPETPPKEIVEAVLGPIYFRLIVTGEPVDDAYISRVVDRVAGAASKGGDTDG